MDVQATVRQRRQATPAFLAIFAGVYLGAWLLGVRLHFGADETPTIWPAAGVLLMALHLMEPRAWWRVLIVAFVAQLAGDVFLAGSGTLAYDRARIGWHLVAGVANIIEGLVAIGVLRWLFGMGKTRVRTLLGLFVLGGVVASALGACIGAAGVVAAHPERSFLTVWQSWWLADWLGMIVVLPAAATAGDLFGRRDFGLPAVKWLEVLALTVLFAVLAGHTFGHDPLEARSFFEMPALLVALLVWAALRFQRLASVLTLALVVLLVLKTIEGRGPFVVRGLDPDVQVLAMQTFLAVTVIVIQVLGAATLDRRGAEDALRAAYRGQERLVAERTAELQEANAELEAFTYSVSHDLRAPLRHIGGFARLLLEELGDDRGEARRNAEVIAGSAAKMATLVDELLELSRLGRQALQRVEVDNEALVREVWSELQGDEAGRADLVLARIPPCFADRSLLRHVWTNLLSNAVKYSAKQEAPRVDVDSHEEGRRTWFRVRDNGAGFDPRYSDKLFAVFQRLHSDEDYPGTGVGLAIVQRIVRRHGGEVRGSGALGEGACFEFTLPREA